MYGQMPDQCSVDGCTLPPKSRGMCKKHYSRSLVHGDPLRVLVILGDDLARFWSKVSKDGPVPAHCPELGPCWLWLDSPDPDGYGYFRVGRKMYRAARFSWGLANGPIPDGLVIDHLCRNRPCVNPRHLEPVTNRVNVVIRGLTPTALNLRKTHCVNGHKFTRANTYVSPSGRRRCRKCQRACDRKRRERQARAA